MPVVKRIPAVAKAVTGKAIPVAVTKTLKAASKGALATIAEIDGAEIYTMDSIELIGRSGGRGASPAVEALKKRATNMKVGQGFIIPEDMRIVRTINSNGTQSTLYTYKGANSLNKLSKNQEFKFRVRRDAEGNVFLFKVTREVVTA